MLRPIENVFQGADYPDLLVGLDHPDDAAVWKIDETRSLIVTTDFFTPVVDDPYDYGSIAAANSLSDVYAMGGTPFLALNIAAVPPQVPTEVISEIFRGGAEKVREAGAVIAGGHTIQDDEPKFGMVVLGFVENDHLLTKGNAEPGDRLVLTKPLSFGVVTTAFMRDQTTANEISEVVGWMSQLNQTASRIAVKHGIRAATDVTGFGLLGHAWEMCEASGAGMRIDFDAIPLLESARKHAYGGNFPGGAVNNTLFYGKFVDIADTIDEAMQMIAFDPQTSGGLLIAVPPEKLEVFLATAKEEDQPAWVIGEVTEGGRISLN